MLARSSSRQGLNSFTPGGVRQSPSPAVSSAGQSPFGSIAREAEEWRKAPAFKRSEVNLTKLEETEGVIALASQWIELDSPDEGVRLDCELALRQELATPPTSASRTSSSHRPHPTRPQTFPRGLCARNQLMPSQR